MVKSKTITRSKPKEKDKIQRLLATFKRFEIKDLRLVFAAERLKTFDKFAYDQAGAKCTSSKLAKAGFCGVKQDSTAAQCPFCGKTMTFDPDDDAWEEHKSHCPECPFVVVGKIDESTWTVEELLNLITALVYVTREAEIAELLQEVNLLSEELISLLS